MISGYVAKIVDENGNDMNNVKVSSNTDAYDEYGNKIVIPAGFKIRVDSTTNNAAHVTEGIVIEDDAGNQFVWIPVGTIYTNTQKTSHETVTLGRYEWAAGLGDTTSPLATLKQPTEENPYTAEVTISGFGETIVEYQKDTETTNAKARDISEFYLNSKENGGYYLGRYEAGKSNNTLVCKAGQTVYKETQVNASQLCKNMYGYYLGTFSSDLLNSYAWDTALVFIQTFGTANYSITNIGTDEKQTGESLDKQLNIYDMAGNAFEWSTETATAWGSACFVRRGFGTASAFCSCGVSENHGFRPVLYIL